MVREPGEHAPLGGPAAKSLLGETLGIGKLRGKWFSYSTPRLSHPIDATPLFHPAYLLRTPGQKRAAWNDLRMIQGRLREIAAKSPLAIAGIKQASNYARDHSVADGLDQIATWNAGMLRPEDLKAALTARAARKQAVFADLLVAES